MTGLPRDAPRPLQRLAAVLAEAGTPLVATEAANARPGDLLYLAHTRIGTVQVWRSSTLWFAELAPSGAGVLVDAGIWEACRRGEERRRPKPGLGGQVRWIEGLLAAESLPPVDAACLQRLASQRDAADGSLRGLRLALVVIAGLVFFVATSWASVAFNQPGLRIVAAVSLTGLVVILLAPAIAKVNRRREERSAERSAEREE